MRLPDEYVNKMKKLLGDDYEAYENSLSQPLSHSLRVNTLKISVEDFLNISPFRLEAVPWTDNAFYYDASVDTPSKHPFYYAGLYYLQEPSATLPAATLPIEEGDRVLDICAAPGGKTTELAAKLKGTGILVSNDISASRLKALQKNVEIFGAENVIITCETPDKLSSFFGAYFDKILIDAPCSGEGMFRKSSSMISAWELNGNEKFAQIQKSILKEIVKMLRPGGKILYSTCTFDPSEDEDQVEYLLSLRDDLYIDSFEKYKDFVDGNPEWSNCSAPHEELKNTAHLFPHKVRGEGHFVALISSDSSIEASGDTNYSSYVKDYKIKKYKGDSDVDDFLSHLCFDLDRSRLELSNGKLFLVPDGSPDVRGLRIMRQGVYLGEIKKNRFEPSQSFAMLLKDEDFDNCIHLSADKNCVFKYLRGETLDIDYIKSVETDRDYSSIKNGWVLICVDRFPLGFAKYANGTIKNKYLPGWRMT